MPAPPSDSPRATRMVAPIPRWLQILLLQILPLAFCGHPLHAAPPAAAEPVVRIAVRLGALDVELTSAGPVRVWRCGSGLRGSVFGPEHTFCARAVALASEMSAVATGAGPARERGIALEVSGEGNAGAYPEELLFEPLSAEHPMLVDGRSYRGEILVRPAADGTLTVVNALHIESYLRGVVPLEIGSSPRIPPAALQAQAIAARSYALFYLGRRREHGCDLLGTTEDQVYGGIAAECGAATLAVEGTRGMVAIHHGRPIRANYCSTCGGCTEASGWAWPGQTLPYLRRVRDRDNAGEAYCAASSAFRWEVHWSCQEFTRIVLQHLAEEVPEARGVVHGKLRGVRVTERTSSRRAKVLEVKTDAGRYLVRGDAIRRILRAPDGRPLRSTLFGNLQRDGAGGCTISLVGGGFGHGVGMCQFGAIELGRRGWSTGQILRHYYRGIELARWW